MFLSKLPNGIYHIYYTQENGKQTKISTRTKLKSEALKFLSNFSKELENRKQLKTTPIGLKSFLFEYLKHSEVIHSINTTKSIKSTVNALQNYFGDIPLSTVNKQKINEYISVRIKKASVYVGKSEKAYLSGIFKYAISKNYLVENPAKGIHKFKVPEKQPLFFSEADFEILLRIVESSDLIDLFRFAVNTGLRQMELLTLEWKQINFKDKYLILDNSTILTKSKKIRTVTLNLTALQILTQRERNKTNEIVFTLGGKQITQSHISHKFKRYVKQSGLNPKLNFHSLRHTFASWLVQAGLSIFEISKLLGHSDIRVTEIYSHLRVENLINSVNKLNN